MTRFLLLLCLATASCGGGKAVALHTKAANDFACPADQIQQSSIAPYVERMVGCGKEDVYVYDRGQNRWVSPLDRAPFDLSCTRDKLTAHHLGARDVGVSGCGQKAVYVLVPASGWVMNTVDRGGAAPAQAPTPAAN